MTTVDGNIESLSRAILGEAQSEIEDLKSDLQARADTILARARAEAEQLRAEILEKARQEARRMKDQAAATAHLKARTLELEHREQLLKRVFDAAAERLGGVPTRKDFDAVVLRLLREALDQLRSGSAIIRADRASQAVLTKAALDLISREAGVDVKLGEVLEHGTGVWVQTADGRLQFDNTLENRLARMQTTLRSEVYRLLTGASS